MENKEIDDITYFKNKLEEAIKNKDEKRIKHCINMINRMEEPCEPMKFFKLKESTNGKKA